MDAPVNLCPSVSGGGWIMMDDYRTYESCRLAVGEYRVLAALPIPS
jgi:hypothetical protein